MTANSRQVGGSHYASAYQHWDFAAAANLGYFEGVITKYLSRFDKKNGEEDLKKAAHYVEKLMELARAGRRCQADKSALSHAEDFCDANNFRTVYLRMAMGVIVSWRTEHELSAALDAINQLISVKRLVEARIDDGSEPGAGYVNQG